MDWPIGLLQQFTQTPQLFRHVESLHFCVPSLHSYPRRLEALAQHVAWAVRQLHTSIQQLGLQSKSSMANPWGDRNWLNRFPDKTVLGASHPYKLYD